jgi:RNA recognition motif-containing protein
MKLLVRNLTRTTTEEELRVMFEALGKVQSCSLVIDKETGKSKGFAFIEMPRPGDAKAAVKTLNGKNLAGNVIRVKKAAPKQSAVEKINVQKPATVSQESENKKPEVETKKSDEEPKKVAKVKEVEKKNTKVNRNIWSK